MWPSRFIQMRLLLFIIFSIAVPLGFLVDDPHRGLWALKSPNMILGCGIWSMSCWNSVSSIVSVGCKYMLQICTM